MAKHAKHAAGVNPEGETQLIPVQDVSNSVNSSLNGAVERVDEQVPDAATIEEQGDPYGPGKKGSWRDNFIVASIAAIVLITLGEFAGDPVLALAGKINGLTVDQVTMASTPGALDFSTLKYPEWLSIAMYASFIGIWVVLLVYMALTKRNRVLLKHFKPGYGGNTLKNFLLGLGIGFAMNALCAIVSIALGNISITLKPLSLALFGYLILGFFAVMIQSGAEEVIDRGFIYLKLRRKYKSPLVAIIVSSCVFAILHLMNPGVGVSSIIDIIASGLLFAAMMYYWGSIWAAIACHTAWNFTQNMLFGLPNSGLVLPLSLFQLGDGATNGIAYTTSFGIEGSILGIGVQFVALAIIIIVGERKKRHVQAQKFNF